MKYMNIDYWLNIKSKSKLKKPSSKLDFLELQISVKYSLTHLYLDSLNMKTEKLFKIEEQHMDGPKIRITLHASIIYFQCYLSLKVEYLQVFELG